MITSCLQALSNSCLPLYLEFGKSVCIQSAEDNLGGKKNLISLQHSGRLGFNLLKSIGRFDQVVSFRDIQIAGAGSVCIRFVKENRCPHTGKNGAVVLKPRSQRCMHRTPAAGPEVSAETPLGGEEWWERMGRTGTSRSLAQNAAQPCLCDVYNPLTVRVKRAGSKAAVSPEIALPSAERPKNSRIPQMNSPAQLLEACSSWHSWVTPHTA